LALACFLLLGNLDNPRIAGLHGFDILRLVAIGALFGVSLGFFFEGRGSS
jgi:hypothetical protein